MEITRLGLVSDTHGMLRKGAVSALEGVQYIIHAGDIDTGEVLESLEKIAPVTAVRGNMDSPRIFPGIPEWDLIDISGMSFYVIHDLNRMDIRPEAAGVSVVVSGHTHHPEIGKRNGVLYLNPGSAGPKRLGHPVTIGILEIRSGQVQPEIIGPDIIEIDGF
ncbi:MAG: metallophosphoesterase family protein [Deltaproteobacteria bacterium]|nr:metallophosphoesterase family protein [Deltaproteobacteria bacterium]